MNVFKRTATISLSIVCVFLSLLANNTNASISCLCCPFGKCRGFDKCLPCNDDYRPSITENCQYLLVCDVDESLTCYNPFAHYKPLISSTPQAILPTLLLTSELSATKWQQTSFSPTAQLSSFVLATMAIQAFERITQTYQDQLHQVITNAFKVFIERFDTCDKFNHKRDITLTNAQLRLLNQISNNNDLSILDCQHLTKKIVGYAVLALTGKNEAAQDFFYNFDDDAAFCFCSTELHTLPQELILPDNVEDLICLVENYYKTDLVDIENKKITHQQTVATLYHLLETSIENGQLILPCLAEDEKTLLIKNERPTDEELLNYLSLAQDSAFELTANIFGLSKTQKEALYNLDFAEWTQIFRRLLQLYGSVGQLARSAYFFGTGGTMEGFRNYIKDLPILREINAITRSIALYKSWNHAETQYESNAAYSLLQEELNSPQPPFALVQTNQALESRLNSALHEAKANNFYGMPVPKPYVIFAFEGLRWGNAMLKIAQGWLPASTEIIKPYDQGLMSLNTILGVLISGHDLYHRWNEWDQKQETQANFQALALYHKEESPILSAITQSISNIYDEHHGSAAFYTQLTKFTKSLIGLGMFITMNKIAGVHAVPEAMRPILSTVLNIAFLTISSWIYEHSIEHTFNKGVEDLEKEDDTIIKDLLVSFEATLSDTPTAILPDYEEQTTALQVTYLDQGYASLSKEQLRQAFQFQIIEQLLARDADFSMHYLLQQAHAKDEATLNLLKAFGLTEEQTQLLIESVDTTENGKKTAQKLLAKWLLG